jgi:hypothetical protein
VGGGEAGRKAKMTLDAGGKSVSEKSQATSGLQEPLLFVREVKDKRMTKNGPEFLIVTGRKLWMRRIPARTLDNTVDDIQETRDDNGGDDARARIAGDDSIKHCNTT